MIHELKILPNYFEDVLYNGKNFEIRLNDRDFKVGDLLMLKEWDGSCFTGRYVFREIVYIYFGDGSFGLSNGYVIMSLKISFGGAWYESC